MNGEHICIFVRGRLCPLLRSCGYYHGGMRLASLLLLDTLLQRLKNVGSNEFWHSLLLRVQTGSTAHYSLIMHSFVMLMRTPCSKTSVTSLHTCHWITQFSVRLCAQRGQRQRTFCLGCCSRCNFCADGSKNVNKTQRVSTPRSAPLKKKTFSTCFPGKVFCILCYDASAWAIPGASGQNWIWNRSNLSLE